MTAGLLPAFKPSWADVREVGRVLEVSVGGGRAQLSHPRGGWRALDHAPQRREVPVPPRPCASPPVGLSPRWGV